jgi:TolB-like protein/Tfp pilus assembly protein PilF
LPVPDIRNKQELSGHLWAEIKRRGILRAGISYLLLSALLVLIYHNTGLVEFLPDWSKAALFIVLAVGFLIALYLAWNFERSPQGFVRTTSDQSWKNPLKASQRKPLTNHLVQVTLVVGIIALYLFSGIKNDPGQDVPSEKATSVYPNKSIAVLPFKNLSGNEENLYFSDGVMEAILNNLSRIKDLKVISRTSVEKYRDQNKSIKEIAQELEVAHILEGSVQRVGDEVRITAQLISAVDDEHIWADNYDRQLNDIFILQSEIAQTIAENLEVIVTTEERDLIKNAPTSNLRAYELYLKASHVDGESESDILEAIALCEEAIKLDPDFGWPYAMKTWFMTDLALYGYDKTIWFDSAMVLVDMSIKRDPKNFMAHSLKGYLNTLVHKDEQAINNYERSIELNPNNGYAFYRLGQYYMRTQDYEKAIQFILKGATLEQSEDADRYESYGYFLTQLDIEQAYNNFLISYQNDPTNPQVVGELMICSRYFKEFARGLEYAKEVLKLRPDLVNAKNAVAESYLFAGEYEEAKKYYLEMLEEVRGYSDDYMIFPFMHRLGYAMMNSGQEIEGRAHLETYRKTLLEAVENKQAKAFGMGEYYDLAIISASLGEKDEAYKWLKLAREKEVTEGAFFRIDFLVSDSMLDNLRDDPEFQDILYQKLQSQEEIKRIFYRKLSEYHDNNELKWLKTIDSP